MVFLSIYFVGIEALHFGIDFGGIIGGVKKRQTTHSRTTVLERVPKCFIPIPIGVTTPTPVTTTRFFISILWPAAPGLCRADVQERRDLLLHVGFDIVDSLSDGLDLFGFFVRNFDVKTPLPGP